MDFIGKEHILRYDKLYAVFQENSQSYRYMGALTVEIQSMLSGKQSAEEAAKKAQEKWEKIFNE